MTTVRAAAALLCALAWLTPVMAGAQTRVVSGSLVDSTGLVVPDASITLGDPPAAIATASGPDGSFRLTGVAPGSYRLSIVAGGFAPVRRTVTIAADDVTLPVMVLTVAAIGETVVVTASRTEGTLVESPAAISVIPASDIRTSPAQNYGDLLRAVPGLNVIQLSARDVNVTSRQATSTLATSQLALLDGRSLYLDFYGLVLWDAISIDRADIKQIEVVRGPASAVWGANALTGVVNIITKTPRESAGSTRVVLSAGTVDRNAGASAGASPGGIYSAGVSTAHVLNARWSYRVSAGYFNSAAYARPAGQIPVTADPRDPTGQTTVGGATYPADSTGPFGTAYENTSTSQPRFDARFDREDRRGRLTLEAGTAGTTGTIFTATGPFKIQPGSMLSYGRVKYSRDALTLSAFGNFVDAKARNQLLTDPSTARPIALDFTTQTFDIEASHRRALGHRNLLVYGGNYRRNNFEVTLAPAAPDRNELGAFVQDEAALGRVKLSLGARVDKFGDLPDAVLSPRLAVIFQPYKSHALRVSVNRAFRSPSAINDFIDERLVVPVDLRGLAPLLPPPLQPLATARFPLVVSAVGGQLPIGGAPQPRMTQESVTAYEWAYLATVHERTTLGANFYVNDYDHQIGFIELPRNADPYTAANPPPGWMLPPIVLTQMAQLGIFLPHTGFTYRNLGPTRQKGVELSVEQRMSAGLSTSVNYSWQGRPAILDDADPFPSAELSLPPAHRINAAVAYEGPRYLGSLSANHVTRSFWSDVLTPAYHGFAPEYTLVNLSAGVKWRHGTITTSLKSLNVLNRTVQQHVFGDLIRRSILGEVRFEL